jgi:hypothetical protein
MLVYLLYWFTAWNAQRKEACWFTCVTGLPRLATAACAQHSPAGGPSTHSRRSCPQTSDLRLLFLRGELRQGREPQEHALAPEERIEALLVYRL